ncbi:NAD(P)/FAD-dependent oxidoreductase [Streptomyces sp. NBC_01304]|uniref:NAD(P)/FAD-dependent oxidoreductase n=1 Tax=Streptomyces sp. NBC_01304 TaxID=2903818 RepID=UPI002E141146|nr:FAD-dependent oxidoreductase [Streptomyces sp. NBC_01304]
MKVVVIGAGYAGTTAANGLAKKMTGAEITVINPRADFVERVRLHQQVAGTAVAATPLTGMLGKGITARVATVDKIGDGTVVLDDGESIDFDYAFLAVGSTVRPLPGTVPIGTWEGAEEAREALAALPAGSTVTVVGGGATGIETASEVAEARSDLKVRIVGSSVAESYSGTARQLVRTGLERLGVDIVDDGVAEVTAGSGRFDGAVRLRSGAELASDLTLWAIVGGVPDLAARSGLDVDAEGLAIVDASLRSVSDERIFVIGDCAAIPGARMSCQSAGPQGSHAVGALVRLAKGEAPESYTPKYAARCVSLGRKNAVAQFTHGDDSLKDSKVSGRVLGAGFKGLTLIGAKFSARKGM